MRYLSKILILTLSFSICFTLNEPVNATKEKKKKKEPEKKDDKPVEQKGITETTKKCKAISGLFTIYQDTTTGSCFILVKKEQLEKEFIYFSHSTDGVAMAGAFRGSYRDTKIFKIKKYFNKIEFVWQNTSFYFNPNNEISKSANANVSNGTLTSQTILAEDKVKGDMLIKADDLFLSEALDQIKGSASYLGSLSKEKTKYAGIKSYPKNTDVVVEYVYDNPIPNMHSGGDVADDRYVSLKIQHSFIEVPKNNFIPRKDDPRVGYFSTQTTDMTSISATPYRDFINHWNLEKKDKNALVSEPVEPITWWIENTTPKEYRQTILDAGNRWNEAFETAGFKNAVVMKVQPDDAEWEAGDIRYNVLRWTSSSKPYFGGYGPSFVNPRTGEIMGADIMLEYIFVTNKLKLERTLVASAIETEVEAAGNDMNHFCSLGDHLHLSNLFGMYALSANDAGPEVKDDFLKQSLYYLVLHEMGHTMGLTHNMKATQLYSPADIHNKSLTEKTGIQSSVMDYPSANISSDKSKQGYYFTQHPGPYDKWVIEYAYSQSLSDSTAEENRLKSILSRSTEPALMYGNDADDMRGPGSVAMDPRVMIDDLTNDAITYSIDRIKFAQEVGLKLKQKYNSPDKSYQELQNQFFITNSQIYLSAGIISRYIGGIYVDRGFVGQKGATQPYTPVSYKDQKRAMEAISKYIFSAQAMQYPKELYGYLQTQRRGFSTGEDPRIHERVLSVQKSIFDHLLSVQVLKRITDSEIYGNEYKLSEMMNDITNGVFKEDITTNVSSFRENLQLEYVSRLCSIINPTTSSKYDYRTQSNVLAQLKNIQKMVTANPGLNNETKIHRQHILFKIDNGLKQNK
jgi:hypothetical protein